MARLLRVQFPGAIYHITARGNERRLIFRDDRDRRRFLEKLAESNHFHLLLGTPNGNLSQCMGRLMTAYTVYFNKRHHRVGHLTQGRFAAQLVEGNEYLLKLDISSLFKNQWNSKNSRKRKNVIASELFFKE